MTAAQENEWCSSHSIPVYVTDYSEASVLSILDSTRAQALVSFLNFDNDRYVDIHRAFLGACQLSTQCKRLIPSEWAGNIDDFPHLPAFYCATREPFRQILRQRSSSDVEWTLFNNGWLMDYFLPPHKTYMEAVPDFFPIDPHRWHACIRGTGDELQSWTCGKEIAKAVAQLLASTEQWVNMSYSPALSRLNLTRLAGANYVRVR